MDEPVYYRMEALLTTAAGERVRIKGDRVRLHFHRLEPRPGDVGLAAVVGAELKSVEMLPVDGKAIAVVDIEMDPDGAPEQPPGPPIGRVEHRNGAYLVRLSADACDAAREAASIDLFDSASDLKGAKLVLVAMAERFGFSGDPIWTSVPTTRGLSLRMTGPHPDAGDVMHLGVGGTG